VRGLDDLLDRVDAFQRRHPVLAFPHAVVKRYGEDHGGWLGALIAYYGFLALLPLLLAFVTVVYLLFDETPELMEEILDALWARLPFVGAELEQQVQPLDGSGWVLAVSLLVTLWAGVGVVRVTQDAANTMWGVPRFRRPGFFPKLARGAAVFGVLALTVLATGLLTGLTLALGLPAAGGLLAGVVTIVLNIGLALALFRLLTARSLSWRDLRVGAVLLGVATYLLTLLGGLYVQRVIGRASALYGSFATVIGLFAWVSLQVQAFVFANLVNVVRAERLWPRSLTRRNLGEPDERAARLTMQREAFLTPEELASLDGVAP
jgi:YihY family inner membrane protein